MVLLLVLAVATPPLVRPDRQALATVRIVRPATIQHGSFGQTGDGDRIDARNTVLRTVDGTQRARLIEFP